MASEAVKGSRRAERSGHGLAAGFLACYNGRERQTRADRSEAFLFALSLSLPLHMRRRTQREPGLVAFFGMVDLGKPEVARDGVLVWKMPYEKRRGGRTARLPRMLRTR
jgi:hypothetical protein